MSSDLDRIEEYYDTVPRSTARVEQIGPFTLFAGAVGQQFYARPGRHPGAQVTAADIARVRDRQRELGEPEAFEWIADLHPGLDETVDAAGLLVDHVPLMVQRSAADAGLPPGYRARMVSAEDPLLPAVLAAIGVGFHSPGTAAGPVGASERDALLAGNMLLDAESDGHAHSGVRDAIRNGLTAIATIEDDAGPVAGGSHSPRGHATEITGVATLPAHRRRGIGVALTAVLCADAASRGIDTCFLSAASVDVARIYGRAGFVRIGTACIAGPKPG